MVQKMKSYNITFMCFLLRPAAAFYNVQFYFGNGIKC